MNGPAALVLALAAWLPARAAAQVATLHWGAQAIPALTATAVVPGGETLTELRVVQPFLMLRADAFRHRLTGLATGNFEKWTIPNGELVPGAWGEGFADRRHPHTVFHELMLVVPADRFFLAAGKGFVPFGSDDPMSRPVLRYPVNHHWAQILERAVAIGGARDGPLMLEGSLFNGDEPVSPDSWPAIDRFGDSWSVRLTLSPPTTPLELQVSYAFVHSPENRAGAGPDDIKWSASARWERSPVYGLLEWARTSVSSGDLVYHSVLAEASVAMGGHRPYGRFEVTERPEDDRLADPFRTVWPPLDNSILGVTRWTVVTAGDAIELKPLGPVRLAPVAELSYAWIAKVGGGAFDPAAFYGREHGLVVTLGVRVTAGMRMTRMGRYGSTATMDEPGMHHHDE